MYQKKKKISLPRNFGVIPPDSSPFCGLPFKYKSVSR